MRAQGPQSHILMTGGGVGPSDFFGSEILAKGDFLGSMKYAGSFWVAKKKQKNGGVFLACEKRTKGFFWVIC